MPGLAILFHRLGPYHHARCVKAGARCSLTVIELSGYDRIYQWAKVEDRRGFEQMTLFENSDVDARGCQEINRRVCDALTRVDPAVVAIPGWSHPAALAALLWCLRRERPTVVMSDSTAQSTHRRWHREKAKRRIVRLYNAALVAGTSQVDHVRSLGLPEGSIFCGYDAVDNAHFTLGAQSTRAEAPLWLERLALPRRFFLSSSRFIPEKNLPRLLQAYARYRERSKPSHWRLVLQGDGDLRPDLVQQIAEMRLDADVVLPGFTQYDELPAYYGLASALVLPSVSETWGLVVNEAMASALPVLVSTRCGCAPDLVEDGVNGFTFNPYDIDELAGLMLQIAAMTDEQRHVMGRASQRIIADWGTDRFADGLMGAVQVAMSCPPPKASWVDQALLWALIHR